MSKLNIKSMMDYMHLFLEKYHELKANEKALKQEGVIFRLEKFSEESDTIEVQLIGLNRIFSASAKEIMANEVLMKFSKEDAVIITHIGTKNLISPKTIPKYKFMKLIASLTGDKTLMEIKRMDGKIEKRPCIDALHDPELIAATSDKNKVKVGYIAGFEEHRFKRENMK